MRATLTELIERMTRSEEVTDSRNSVSWQAHREAERLTDVALIDELQGFLVQKPKKDERTAAYFIMGSVGMNCQSALCASRLLSLVPSESDKYALACILEKLADIQKPAEVDLTPVFSLLRDKRWLVRHAAIKALKKSASSAVEDNLLELLSTSSDPHDMIYCHATLNQIGTRKSLDALQRGATSRKRDVKLSALAAIAAIEARDA